MQANLRPTMGAYFNKFLGDAILFLILRWQLEFKTFRVVVGLRGFPKLSASNLVRPVQIAKGNYSMYCPYCGVDHDATVVESVEHIIPYGLGGSDALTILTCDKANNDLGSSVDAPFMDFFPIQAKRFFLGLESTKGNAPVLDLGGTGWIDGRETPISYLITGESKELKVGKPTVVKTPGENGQERWKVSGDPGEGDGDSQGQGAQADDSGQDRHAGRWYATHLRQYRPNFCGKDDDHNQPVGSQDTPLRASDFDQVL